MKYDYPMAPPLREYSVAEGEATTAADQRILAKDIPCQAACPALTNVPLYIEHLLHGDPDGCQAVNLEANVFPGVLGRVCTRPCEDRCRHEWTNTRGPVKICHLKRMGADHATQVLAPPPYFPDSGKRVAIIGGGPAGLSAARELKRCGHDVTLFEREPELGGMMIHGIPRFRLPREVVEQEIRLITETGIHVHLETDVRAERLQQLIDGYDALCIAAGTMQVQQLDLPGIPPEQLISGLDFMHRYNHRQITSLDGDVVVIGGGFTAVDCARSSARAARRLLGEGGNISIYYRRSEHYMAADQEELEEIERENITIRTLATPVRGRLEDGHIAGVTFRRNILETPGQAGKPRMIPVPDSEFEVPCRHIIVAIGQKREAGILPHGLELTTGFRTSRPHVFATGDFATGSDNVINSVANGKAVAEEIDTFLMGARRMETVVRIETIHSDGYVGRVRDYDLQDPAPTLLAELTRRAMDDHEVELGFSPEGQQINAERCYLCHYKFEIDQDLCIHCDWCIDVAPRKCIKRVSRVFFRDDGTVEDVIEATLAADGTYIWIDSDECIRCGKCLRVCPTEAISMQRTERVHGPCKADPPPESTPRDGRRNGA